MNNPITENLPADLPEDWGLDDTLAPDGTYVGLTEQHGYNYLMAAVNAAQRAAKQLGEALAAAKASDFGAIPATEKGKENGVAELDDSGKVPSAQLPAMDYDPAGSADAVQQALNTHTSNKQNPHGVTAAQVGAYTKTQTLQSSTAALYPGLTGDSTPNDAYAFLGGYTQWRWNRRTVSWNTVKGSNTSIDLVTEGETVTLRYSSSVTVSNDGVVSLSGYSIKSITTDNWSSSIVTILLNKYFTVKNGGQVYYFDSESTAMKYVPSGSDEYVKADNVKPVTANKSTGPWEEVRASTDDAYPNSGISGGYEYEALGMPLEKAAALPLTAVLAMLSEQEQLRADVDFLAIMGGVEL